MAKWHLPARGANLKKSGKIGQKTTWGGMGATKKGQNGNCKWDPLNQGVLGLGGHRCQSLGTFYNGAKKLARFGCGHLAKIPIKSTKLVVGNFRYF